MARVSSREGIFALCVFAACWLWSSPSAAAGPIPLELVWRAPASECPAGDALVRQVAALVERQSSSARAVRAVAEVQRLAPQHYRVLLTTESQGARGSRVVEEHSCQALANVVVLILAWMLQPELSHAEPIDRAHQEPPSLSPAALAPPARRSVFGTSEWQLSVRAVGDLGSLPRAAVGGLAALDYRAAPFQLSLQGSYFASRRGEVPKLAGFAATGGDFWLGAVSLLGCFEPTRARVGLCAGPELDYEQGRGFGVSAPGTGEKFWLSLVAGLRSSLHLSGRLWLDVSSEAVVPTLRESFVLQGIGAVHRPSAVSVRASLGLGLTL